MLNLLNLLCPLCIKHLQIFFNYPNLLFLMCLVEIFQDDGDVHVDDNHEIDDDEGDKINDSNKRMTTIAIRQSSIFHVTVWRGNK